MHIDEKYIRFQAAQSSGPGGQRINKRATKVQAWVKIEGLPCSEEEKKKIREKLHTRINHDDELEVESQEERFQEQNRARVIEKINELISEALHENPPRIPTKKPNIIKLREMLHNRLRYQRKKSRREGKSLDIEEER